MLLFIAACAWIPKQVLDDALLTGAELTLGGEVEADLWDACDTSGVRVRATVDPVFVGERLEAVLTLSDDTASLVFEDVLLVGPDGALTWEPPVPARLGLAGAVSAHLELTGPGGQTDAFTTPVVVSSPPSLFFDADQDGFAGTPADLCDPPVGATADPDDCDDGESAVSPVAIEVCDGVDNDCDGDVDAADASAEGLVAAYPDVDQDGYGDAESPVPACPSEVPSGFVLDDTDCDDLDEDARPGLVELCDGVDNDCDGFVDDGADGFSVAGVVYGSLTDALHAVELLPGSVVVSLCGPGAWDGEAFDFSVPDEVHLVPNQPATPITGSAEIQNGEVWFHDLELQGGGLGTSSSDGMRGGALTLLDTTARFEGTDILCADNPPGDIDFGGAVYAQGSVVSFTDGTVAMCHADGSAGDAGGGAIFAIDSELELGVVLFESNHTTGSGGAVRLMRTPLTTLGGARPQLQLNHADGTGGALHLDQHPAQVIRSLDLDGNDAGTGGGLSVEATVSLELVDVTFTDNDAVVGAGGGLYILPVAASAVTLEDVQLFGNTAVTSGGGAHIPANVTATFTNVEFNGNGADDGGGLRAFGDLSLTGVTFEGNVAAEDGGGLALDLPGSDTLTVMDTTFGSNAAGGLGGGANIVDVAGGCGLIEFADDGAGSPVSFTGNTASTGGGLYTRGTCSVVADAPMLFSSNSAMSNGGAYYNTAGATGCAGVELDAVVDFTGNQSVNAGGGALAVFGTCSFQSSVGGLWEGNTAGTIGGAILMTTASSLDLTAAVFRSNTSGGGAVYLLTGSSLACSGCDFSPVTGPNMPNDVSSSTAVWNQGATAPPTLMCVEGASQFCTPP